MDEEKKLTETQQANELRKAGKKLREIAEARKKYYEVMDECNCSPDFIIDPVEEDDQTLTIKIGTDGDDREGITIQCLDSSYGVDMSLGQIEKVYRALGMLLGKK